MTGAREHAAEQVRFRGRRQEKQQKTCHDGDTTLVK